MNIVKTNYSKEELKDFEKLISTKLTDAEKEYNNIATQLKEIMSDSTFDSVKEDISENVVFDELKLLASRLQQYINNLTYALMRIDNGTYGVCKVTGKLIPIERLRAVPIATTCVDAKRA